jgi:hypothetical protein
VVGVQVSGEIGRDVLVRDLERGEICLRAGAEIHHELVAVAKLDEPGAVGLRPAQERPAGTERNHAHLVGGKRLGIGKVVLAPAAHGGCSGPGQGGLRCPLADPSWRALAQRIHQGTH